MVARRPAPTTVRLLSHQRTELEAWVQQPPQDRQSLAHRARIVLLCSDGYTTKEVAAELQTSGSTVCKWRRRYAERGIEGLRDEPRPGAPRSITDKQIEKVIATTLTQTPTTGSWWTVRSMASATQMSPSSVAGIWRDHGIKPNRLEISKFSEDPGFIERVAGCALYLRPPQGVLALFVDQNPNGSSTVSEPAPKRPPVPANLHELLGKVASQRLLEEALAEEHQADRDLDLQRLFRALQSWTARGLDVHVVLDHSSTSIERLRRWLTRNLRFQVHFLPTWTWWLHFTERWLVELTDQGIGWGIEDLQAAIEAWIDTYPTDGEPFVWYDGERRSLRAARKT